ncbi:MAG TPA: hypothetical protein VGI64_15080 [Streptosporangiaceae bacterium]
MTGELWHVARVGRAEARYLASRERGPLSGHPGQAIDLGDGWIRFDGKAVAVLRGLDYHADGRISDDDGPVLHFGRDRHPVIPDGDWRVPGQSTDIAWQAAFASQASEVIASYTACRRYLPGRQDQRVEAAGADVAHADLVSLATDFRDYFDICYQWSPDLRAMVFTARRRLYEDGVLTLTGQPVTRRTAAELREALEARTGS